MAARLNWVASPLANTYAKITAGKNALRVFTMAFISHLYCDYNDANTLCWKAQDA